MNMKKNKSILWLTLAICMLISFFLYHRHEACRYSLQIIETENEGGYGYQILCGDRVVICQPYIPSLPGRKGFASEEDARRVGNLVLERIRSGSDFTISASDLEQVTETNGFLYRAH
ncbi:DUF4907 domain-containing protein [Bacteroides fragilis]|uniref:DUF4907 domain-containing protein n=1 Tax=Bacteroides fragilis TaxID=817 RepID=UPI000EFC7A93|nr:DUF4907 domain-containing protein [Bacteroides fragilis]MBU9019598.1 DUF4907 domain-containing protein [Bacteroides fragilis]MBU9023832.1 DUF4907 domain-containing protein [Bacteroides fragilis]MBU9084517.1 DUF4907 domain-containing protein [Bacteroides fragilis]MCE9100030.1 DUF4907 domain-containing protein [Bacteroides fragilis]RGQ94919.1 DUF4907 domain-containing protein [Bacteroides fragilis]